MKTSPKSHILIFLDPLKNFPDFHILKFSHSWIQKNFLNISQFHILTFLSYYHYLYTSTTTTTTAGAQVSKWYYHVFDF